MLRPQALVSSDAGVGCLCAADSQAWLAKPAMLTSRERMVRPSPRSTSSQRMATKHTQAASSGVTVTRCRCQRLACSWTTSLASRASSAHQQGQDVQAIATQRIRPAHGWEVHRRCVFWRDSHNVQMPGACLHLIHELGKQSRLCSPAGKGWSGRRHAAHPASAWLGSAQALRLLA